MIDHIRDVRERPVWRPASNEAKAFFRRPLPLEGRDFGAALTEFDRYIKPFAIGNTHPLFMGWVQGAGTPVGMIAEMLAAGLDSNCGGRNHIALDVERQIALWMAQAFGFPLDASGIFVTGASMANFLSLLVARERAAGARNVRLNGLNALDSMLVAYASREVHNCVRQAMELSGLGARHLRLIPSDERRAMRVGDLVHAIAADRAAGFTPFMIVGTAGTVDTGAVDDLDALADVAREEDIWFHVDGAYGAAALAAPSARPLFAGIELADSFIVDPHKWLFAPFDCAALVYREPKLARLTHAQHASYLEPLEQSGEWNPSDYAIHLTRRARGLPFWFSLAVYGTDAYSQAIERTLEVARYTAKAVHNRDYLTLVREPDLSVVCFKRTGWARDDYYQWSCALRDGGIAFVTPTTHLGEVIARVAIVNPRTSESDIDVVLDSMA